MKSLRNLLSITLLLALLLPVGAQPAPEQAPPEIKQPEAKATREEQPSETETETETEKEEEEEEEDVEGPAGWRKRFLRRKDIGDDYSSALPHVPADLDTYIKVGKRWYFKPGGYLHLDAITDLGDHGDPFSLTPAAIPVNSNTSTFDETNFLKLGPDMRFSLRRTRVKLDIYTTFPKLNDGTRFYVEGDFFGKDGSPRLRHALVALPYMVLGRTNSAFKDPDSEPETVDFNGPNATIGSRQQGIRFILPLNDYELAVAFEDTGGIITPSGIQAQEDFLKQEPDIASHFRANQDWGHLQLSGILRRLTTDEFGTGSESFTGYGLGVTGQVFTKEKDNVQFGIAYGDGIGSRINGLAGTSSEVGLDEFGVLGTQKAHSGYLAYQHWWNDSTRSTAYLSTVFVNRRSGAASDDFQQGSNVAVNVIKDLNEHIKVGGEFMVGSRRNVDGRSKAAARIQAMFRYTF